LKDKTAKFAVVLFLKRIPIFLGYLFFLSSVISPFYYIPLYVVRGIDFPSLCSKTLWSFKSFTNCYVLHYDRLQTMLALDSEQRFIAFWSDPFLISSGLCLAFVSMFAVQVSVLTIATICVAVRNRVLAIVLALLCPLVAGIMMVAGIVLQQKNFGVGFYAVGYWLTYPSEACFVANFFLRCRNPKTKKLPTPQNQPLDTTK
jgi:hypothetical protein